MPTPVTRFAPSPTGYLHLGHVASALFVWGLARRWGAAVLLRIEDHDRGRCRPEYERAIFDDLAWLGFRHDNGDLQAERRPSPYRQSDATAYFQETLAQLAAERRVYACACSRKRLAAACPVQGEDGERVYDGCCRDLGLPLDAPGTGLRLVLDDEDLTFTDLRLGPLRQNPARQCGDLLLRDRHGQWTYQFAVTADDLRHGVTHVVRGEDLVASTARQILLGRWLGRPEEARFYHHPLIRDEQGQKLGKRFFSEAVAKRRAAGETPERVLGEAAHLVGLLPRPEPVSAREITALLADQGCCS